MKRLFKKNQIIITTLAIMIAVAGYLNYSGRIFGETGKAEATNGELANQELLDITLKVRIRKWQTERWKERREKQCLPMEM